MKWNTRSFTNITDEVFVGTYNSVDFTVNPGETRYFPSEVSEHITRQLILKITKKVEGLTATPYYDGILGGEIKTIKEKVTRNFKEEVEEHEAEFKKMQEDKKKENLLKRDEALEIAKEKVEPTESPAKENV